SPHIPDELKDFEDHIITTDNLFEQTDLPRRMAVIGLGPVGMEMAQALARLGIEVTAIDHNGHIGGIADHDINQRIQKLLKQDMRLWMGAKPEYARAGDSVLIKNKDEMVKVDAMLVAAGRTPNLNSLGIKQLAAVSDGDGVPHFDRRTMQIKSLPVYIAGDATDEHAMLHEAIDDGKRAAHHALSPDKEMQPRNVPLAITFTHPTIAIIGNSYYTMRKHDMAVGEASYEDQGRATIENEKHGKIRIIADKDSKYIRGCELMAPEGEHLAHLIAFAIERSATVADMLDMPFYHPSFEEGLRSALKQIENPV
ncbi:MAG: FAD-dependent oxidoreductase, partial [Alphaproteobacteria bacterium]